MSFEIIKATGNKEKFDLNKVRRSLKKSGAPDDLIQEIVQEIEKNKTSFTTTRDIYNFALHELKKTNKPVAARYNLKHALMALGPAGFPFEQFVAELFRKQNYEVETNKTVAGYCVEHEVDIIAHKNNEHMTIECKFHNRSGLKSDIKVALYCKARFDDLQKGWKNEKEHTQEIHSSWVVTNTKLTKQALQYGTCAGLNMLDWKHPEGSCLPDLITKAHLHPITALTTLSKSQQKQFIKDGFVLCSQAKDNRHLLKKYGLSEEKIEEFISEAEAVCKK